MAVRSAQQECSRKARADLEGLFCPGTQGRYNGGHEPQWC